MELNTKTASWKTSTAGIAGYIAVVALAVKNHFDGDPATVVDWASLIASTQILFVAFFARDNNKTSEQVGAGVTK